MRDALSQVLIVFGANLDLGGEACGRPAADIIAPERDG
jgi:hypothetical protein